MITLHGIRNHFPKRMDTRKFHAEMKARQKTATQQLRLELDTRTKSQPQP